MMMMMVPSLLEQRCVVPPRRCPVGGHLTPSQEGTEEGLWCWGGGGGPVFGASRPRRGCDNPPLPDPVTLGLWEQLGGGSAPRGGAGLGVLVGRAGPRLRQRFRGAGLSPFRHPAEIASRSWLCAMNDLRGGGSRVSVPAGEATCGRRPPRCPWGPQPGRGDGAKAPCVRAGAQHRSHCLLTGLRRVFPTGPAVPNSRGAVAEPPVAAAFGSLDRSKSSYRGQTPQHRAVRRSGLGRIRPGWGPCREMQVVPRGVSGSTGI